jgi:hypothetical protein
MTTRSSIENHGLSSFVVFNPSFKRFLSLISRVLFVSLLLNLIWLPGLFINPALAVPIIADAMPTRIASQVIDSAAEGDRFNAVIACLPKQLSQPNLKRALTEMGNGQLERGLKLKGRYKLNPAEIELQSCMNQKGFANLSD